MTLLAFDCAAGGASVAVARGDGLTIRVGPGPDALLDLIADAMAAAGVEFSGLSRIVTTVGPGHFTGLRVGLAAARGLALANKIPAGGCTTFAALAWGVPAAQRAGRRVLVAVDSKRQELFFQLHDEALAPLGAPLQCAPAALPLPAQPLVVTGDPAAVRAIVARAPGALAAPAAPDAAAIVALARAGAATMPLSPHYVRAVHYATIAEQRVLAQGGQAR